MKWKVLKVGGSILYPSFKKPFQFSFAKNLLTILEQNDDYQFSLTAGGGKLTRELYKDLREEFPNISEDNLHKVGVVSSNVNNELLRVVFSRKAFPRVLRYKEYEEFLAGDEIPKLLDYKYIIAASSKPGFSNDWNALQMTLRLHADSVISIKNIEGIYTADPLKDSSATMIPKLSWDEYFDIIGNPEEFEPGGNFPIDVETAREANKQKKAFIIVGSDDTENISNAIKGEEFLGTIVS